MLAPLRILAALLLLLPACYADLFQYTSQLPACGLNCILQTIPASECKTFTNSTCICTSSSLVAATDACVTAKCSVLDRLKVAKVNAEACNIPKEMRRPQDISGMGILDASGPIFMLLRLYCRYMLTGKMEPDDWITVVTFIVYIPFTVLGVIIRVVCIGYNIWDVAPETITYAFQLFFIDELFYTLTLALLRVSLLFFLLRVFPSRKFSILCWITMSWVVVSALVVIIMTAFQCLPIHYNWDGWTGEFVGEYHCLNVNALSYAAAGSGILQDLAILILPLPVVARLQMPTRKRLMTLLMFSLGVFIIITSCIRLQSLVAFAKSENPTWDYVDAVLWTSLEVNISVLIVCLPSVRALFAKWLPDIFSSIISPSKKTETGGTSASSGAAPERPRLVRQSRGWDELDIEMDSGSERGATAGAMDFKVGSLTTMESEKLSQPRREGAERSKDGSKRQSWWRHDHSGRDEIEGELSNANASN